jgi:hypothetical protein
MPEPTMAAFKNHGQPKITLDEGIEGAEPLFREMDSLGIPLTAITDLLEKEGVTLFSDAFFSILKEIAGKRDAWISKA